MALCAYCNSAPPILHSHVIPRFVGKYIKNNSPFEHMLNLWMNRSVFDLHKGPYLCAKCDNEVFSGWENHFSRTLWTDPLKKGGQLSDEVSVRFITSLAYRYTLHFLTTSPIAANSKYSEYMRDLTRNVLDDPSKAGQVLRIYPYVYRPIHQGCGLMPGVNHLLSLAVHAESLPREGHLPNAMLVIIPKMLTLFCDGDLAASHHGMAEAPVDLQVGRRFEARIANAEFPVFLKSVLNRLVAQGQSHQKQLGRWKKLAYSFDKQLNSHKMCYVANEHDRTLLKWQRDNCRT